MLLAIDSGNTSIKFGLFQSQKLKMCDYINTKDAINDDFMYSKLLSWLKVGSIDINLIEGVIVSSVVPSLNKQLITLAQNLSGSNPLFIGDPSLNIGIKILVDKPAEVGADRLVNAIAGHTFYSTNNSNLLILDFGTATTFDIVDSQGNYSGGVIAPGINVSLEALEKAAENLPLIPIIKPKTVIGKNTIMAMQSGIYWGYIGLIEGLVNKIKEEINSELTVIATGGLAHQYSTSTDSINIVDKNLTIKGLGEIWLRNQ